MEFIARTSRWRLFVLGLLAMGFVIAGLWMIGVLGDPPQNSRYSPPVRIFWGSLSVLFFGWCAVVIAKRFLEGGDRVRIGTEGIWSADWSDDTIPWSEIVDVSEWSFRRQHCMVLHLRDPARFPSRGSRALFQGLNRGLTGGDVAISFTGTDQPFRRGMEAVSKFRPVA